MSSVQVNGLQLEYEIIGDATALPLLLIMGLGMQMIAWPDPFCVLLAARGFRVIRFDNRDVGLSTKFGQAGMPNVPLEFAKYMLRLPMKSPYYIDDMSRDAAGLLDALGIARAHVVGASMGGMIAQNLAAHFPHKVQSLTSIMSTTGRRSLPGPTWKARNALLAPPARRGDIPGAIARMKKVLRVIGSPGFPEDDAVLDAMCERHVLRSNYPQGVARQLVAVAASGDRSRVLKTITAPTLVIHGQNDPLLPVAAGIDTARVIPQAKLSVIPGMGHDLPVGLHARLVEEIAAHCRRNDMSGAESVK
ncbi:MAG TPA: alpha/beta hydrolase [Usitatibacteraceae bacterium]